MRRMRSALSSLILTPVRVPAPSAVIVMAREGCALSEMSVGWELYVLTVGIGGVNSCQPSWRKRQFHGGRTVGVIVAFAFCGYGGRARGCPDTPVAAAPDDDLDIRECTRVDAHDVRALLHGR